MENNKKGTHNPSSGDDISGGRRSGSWIVMPFRILSSRALLIWMSGAWAVYYVMSAIWVKEAFADFVSGLSGNPLIMILYVIFLASGLGNLIRASVGLFRTERSRFFTWFMLPAGMLLFLAGFFMSVTMRQVNQSFVGEGDVIGTPWSGDRYYLKKIDPGLKERVTDLDAATGIFSYEPKLAVIDNLSRSSVIGAFPPAKLGGTYYHILNFGIAPGVRLFQEGALYSNGYMIVNILTPGSSDTFEITNLPYRFQVSLEPEKTLRQEGQTVSHFNLKTPRYTVRIYRGEKIIAEGPARDGIRFDDNMVYLYDPIFWVLLESVKDPGVPVMHSGIVLAAFGFPVYVIGLLPGYFRGKKAERQFT